MSILNDPMLVNYITDILSEHVVLPDHGYLAGGAVANTILMLEDGKKYPINDIDIFRPNVIKMGNYNSVHRHIKTDIVDDEHYNFFLRNIHDSYQITDSIRKGKLNLIDVSFLSFQCVNDDYIIDHNYYYDHLFRNTLLMGFDLNCCHAGIDLYTRDLFVTDMFRDFLSTRQLAVHTPVTPFHTAIRLIKKKRELNCYLNTDEQMEYLSYIPLLLEIGTREYSKVFGRKYYEDYLKYRDVIDKYFKVVELPNNRYTMIPELDCRNIPKEYKSCKYLREVQAVWDMFYGKTEAQKKKIRMIYDIEALRYLVLNDARVADCDVSNKQLRRIKKFVSAHRVLAMYVAQKQMTTQEIILLIDIINRVSSTVGFKVIGQLEYWVTLNDANTVPEVITEEWLLLMAEDYKKISNEELRLKVDISNFRYRCSIKELITIKELDEEGYEMRHCIGGYAYSLRNKHYRVFSIITLEGRSTLCISTTIIEGYMKIDIVEHRGRDNGRPPDEHKKISEDLIDHLNEMYKNKPPDGMVYREALITIGEEPF